MYATAVQTLVQQRPAGISPETGTARLPERSTHEGPLEGTSVHTADTAFSPREIKAGRRAIGVYVALAVLAVVAARVLPMTGWLTPPSEPVASSNIADAQPLSDVG